MFARLIRRALFIATTFIGILGATHSLAQTADYECSPAQGCKEETGASHEIEGIKLTTPEGWRYYSYPMPPDPPGLTNIRIVKGDVIVAITGFPNLDGRQITEEWLKTLLEKAVGQHVGVSTEKAFNYRSLSRDGIVGGYVSFTANPGAKPFKVLGESRSAAVTTFILSNQRTILSISVVSNSSPDADYIAAREMIRNVR